MNDITVLRDIPYAAGRDARNCFDLCLPAGDAPCPLLIYFYGGSLKKGKKDKNAFAPAAARAGIAVAVADYRLIPEVSYPTFIEDAADAVASILVNIHKYTDRINKFYIGGHSAGAYLSMMLCFDRHYLVSRGVDRSLISGWLFISGQPTTHMSILEAGGADKRSVIIDDTAALWYVNSPEGEPLLIATSDCDMPNRREQNYLLRGTLRRFEYAAPIHFIDLTGCAHGAFVKPDENGNVPILPYILKFINET